LINLHGKTRHDEWNPRLCVVQAVPMTKKSFLEKTLAMIRCDDHRRRPSGRPLHGIDDVADRPVDVRSGVEVHPPQIVAAARSDLCARNDGAGYERLDELGGDREGGGGEITER